MNDKINRLAGLSAAFAATLLTLTVGCKPSTPANESTVDTTALGLAPAWALKDVDGQPVNSTDFAGKVVILDFWATWCGPCRMEIPGFIELQKQYGDQGLVVVGVSLDQEGAVAVKPFIKKSGINYPIVLGNETITSAFGGVEGIPTTFIIDRQGQIVRKHVGYTEKERFEAEVKPLLKL